MAKWEIRIGYLVAVVRFCAGRRHNGLVAVVATEGAPRVTEHAELSVPITFHLRRWNVEIAAGRGSQAHPRRIIIFTALAETAGVRVALPASVDLCSKECAEETNGVQECKCPRPEVVQQGDIWARALA